ncbi:MAG: response regulator transcription factor [Chloroflexota bacterium]
MAETRTIVVDDHDVARLGLVAILESIPGVSVVAEASDAQTALDEVRTHRPDLVLMDVRMPHTDGLTTAQQIRATWPETQVVMVSYWDVPEYQERAWQAGATGYISKGATRDEIVGEIDRVRRGERRTASPALPPSTATPAERPSNGRSSADAYAAIHKLTPRQRQVLELTAAGLKNREIGERLGIGWRTVQKNMEHVFRHLSVPNRTQAAMVWMLSGWGSQQPPGAGLA